MKKHARTIAAALVFSFGSVNVYVPGCRVRQFNAATGALDVENFCTDFEILH